MVRRLVEVMGEYYPVIGFVLLGVIAYYLYQISFQLHGIYWVLYKMGKRLGSIPPDEDIEQSQSKDK